jgi:hypothetical protein
MAFSAAVAARARQVLSYGFQSQPAATDFVSVVNAGSGTLQAGTQDRIRRNISDRVAANGIISAVNAGTALSARQRDLLGIALRNRVVASQIATELAL